VKRNATTTAMVSKAITSHTVFVVCDIGYVHFLLHFHANQKVKKEQGAGSLLGNMNNIIMGIGRRVFQHMEALNEVAHSWRCHHHGGLLFL